MANLGYMQVVRGCNQYCRFCSNPSTGYQLDLETARREVDDFAARGYCGVILTGGEPSLSEIVPEVTRYAVSRGLHVRTITNGSRLSTPGLAEEYVAAGLVHFHVSLHTAREELQDFLTGVKGSWAMATRAIANLGAAGAVVDVNTVINRFNADHLDETVRFLLARFPFNGDPEGLTVPEEQLSHQVSMNPEPRKFPNTC